MLGTSSLRPSAATRSQGDNGQGSNHQKDPCDQLPDPPGEAKGIQKRCPEGGSSSGVAKGDFNGDNFADLAIGAPGVNLGGQSGAGVVQVIYGSPSGLTTNTFGFPAPQFWSQSSTGVPGASEAGDQFGAALAAGDFNGDGFSDLAIGVPGDDITYQGTNYQDWGGVIVIYGSRSGLTTTDSSVPAARFFDLSEHYFERDGHAKEGARLGQALTWGDFNGDGAGDLAIGAPDYTLDRGFFQSQNAEAGAVWILYGVKKTSTNVGGLTTASDLLLMELDITNRDFSFEAEPSLPGDHFGAALASGDFDGDGRFDLAIGIPDKKTYEGVLFPTLIQTEGIVLALYGTSVVGINLSLGFRDGIPVLERHGRLGAAMAVGDFNGDGKSDLAIAAPNDEPGDKFSLPDPGGKVRVDYGSSTGLHTNIESLFSSVSITGVLPEAGEGFGAALTAGDFNGDGKSDLAIGVPFKDVQVIVNGTSQTLTNAGEVDIIYGSTTGVSLDAKPPQRWTQENAVKPGSAAPYNHFGASLTAWNFGRNEFVQIANFAVQKIATDLAIGVPDQNVGGLSNSGAVNVMYGSFISNGLTGVNSKGVSNNIVLTQPILGVAAQANARFGSALY
jgi:hypothetical protein